MVYKARMCRNLCVVEIIYIKAKHILSFLNAYFLILMLSSVAFIELTRVYLICSTYKKEHSQLWHTMLYKHPFRGLCIFRKKYIIALIFLGNELLILPVHRSTQFKLSLCWVQFASLRLIIRHLILKYLYWENLTP